MAVEIRVLHLIDNLGGGGAEHALRLQLPGLARQGVDSMVVCLGPAANSLTQSVRDEGTPVVELDAQTWLARIRAVRREIRRFSPDVVHATLVKSALVSRFATPRGVALVNSLVNTTYSRVRVSQLGIPSGKLRALRVVDQLTARRVDQFHVLTEAVREEAMNVLKVDRDRTTLIPRGRDAHSMGNRNPQRRADVRKALGVSNNVPVIINVARQEPQKGQVTLIRAFASVLTRVPHALLLIVGLQGASTKEIESAIAAEDVGGSVKLLGYRSDVPDLLACADLFAFPSHYEGLGSAVIEAMALGLPVVASDIAPIREVLDDGRAGVLVQPRDMAAWSDALGAVLLDNERSSLLAAAGLSRFRTHFELAQVVRDTAALYRQVADQSR